MGRQTTPDAVACSIVSALLPHGIGQAGIFHRAEGVAHIHCGLGHHLVAVLIEGEEGFGPDVLASSLLPPSDVVSFQ